MSLYISVVVCTYNRSDLLKSCLHSLNEQTINRNHYEVIIVDNNSTDQTEEVANSFTKQYINFRYCKELKQGLSHARNRGYKEACGKYVAYVDDDCKLPEQWLVVAKEIIDKASPSVFGGPFSPFYNTSKPAWFQDCYESGGHIRGNDARPVEQNEYLSGGNIFFKRMLLESLEGFDVNLGMSGKKMAYGEETALQKRIRNTKPDALIYYAPNLYAYHLVRPEKMVLKSIVRQRFINGRHRWLVLQCDSSMKGQLHIFAKAVYALFAIAWKIIYGMFMRDRVQYPYFQNYTYECGLRHVVQMGQLYEQFKYLRKTRN